MRTKRRWAKVLCVFLAVGGAAHAEEFVRPALAGSAAAGGGVVPATSGAFENAETPDQSRIVLTNYYLHGGPKMIPAAPLPPDPWGPERMALPTPVAGHGLAGVPDVALNSAPDAKTMGIRLDTSYGFLRETYFGNFISEYQYVLSAGATFLPYQSPCLILGTRILGNWNNNNSMVQDSGGLSLDVFGGTRYKGLYLKMGPLWDYQEQFSKVGFTVGTLYNVPVLGPWSSDLAVAWGSDGDVFGPTRDPINNLNLRRVEAANFDCQLRVGRFFSPYCQAGVTGNYYNWTYTSREWGAGAFLNVFFGRLMTGLDLTGGAEGLRGYVTFGYSWGAPDCEHPQDCNLIPVDTVGWVTRAVLRDPSIRLRESFTGPRRTSP